MTRKQEIQYPNSSLNKAYDDEPLFILRARDPASLAVISYWITWRTSRGLNKYMDDKMCEAIDLSRQIRAWRTSNSDMVKSVNRT